jgi:hypothetical protein
MRDHKEEMMNVPSPPPEFTDDIPYEIDQLRAACSLLLANRQFDVVIKNALIESVAVHARNLVEMFLNKENGLKARDFTRGYTNLDQAKLKTLYSKICAGVSHLNEDTQRRVGGVMQTVPGRSSQNTVGKFDATDPNMIGLIEDELQNFINHLNPGLTITCSTGPITVPAPPQASATNDIRLWTGPLGPQSEPSA